MVLSGVPGVRGEKPAEMAIPTLVAHLIKDEVEKVGVKPEGFEVTLKNGSKAQVRREGGHPFDELMKNYGVTPEQLRGVAIEVKQEHGAAYWFGILFPFLGPLLLIGLLIFFMARQVQGANMRALSFGQAGAREVPKDAAQKVTFKEVAGMKESKEELEEVVEFLKDTKRFTAMGAKIPKGVLLMGPPGCGKTLLAKAVAGEANVPFFHISGSEFVEMFVGVGAARVRDLFRRAKKSAPAIVFIDEIDAVGRRRGAGLGGSHDEREQTLNQILVEMDGFDPNIGVVVVAATNRPDVLDPALLRPGRFDRRVTIDVPDINEREEILKIHAQGKPLSKETQMRTVAERTPGFTGADIANLLNEATILTVRRGKKQVTMDEILPSIEKVLLGPERKSRILSDRERKITAYHEAGHALVAHFLPHADPVRKISIISRGHAGGYTLKMPTEDKRFRSKAEFLDDIAVMLGGYMAEVEIFGKDALSTGPSSDLRQATSLARRIITDYGMSEKLPPRTFGEHEELIFLGREISEQRDYSEKTAEMIDAEISRVIEDGKKRAGDIIRAKRDIMETLVEVLLQKETLEQEAFEKIVGPKSQIPR